MNIRRMVFVAAVCAAVFGARGEIVIRDGETIAFMGDSITQYGNNPVGYVNLVMKGLEIAGKKGRMLTSDGVHMAYEGNKMMAWGILRTMGVPAETEKTTEGDLARKLIELK